MPPMPRPRCANAPATAKLFIQLSMRRPAVSYGLPILDLLLPVPLRVAGAASIRAHHAVSHATTRTSCSNTGNVRQWRGGPSATTLVKTRTSARAFSTSPAWRATHTLFNPQMDEDGQEMVLQITPRAAKRLSEIMTKDSNPTLALRVQVESGGCHGFQYMMKLVTLPSTLPTANDASAAAEDSIEAIREDDTIFTFAPDDSTSAPDLSAPKIILDFPSLELLKGSKVDFTMELIGSQFKIVDNPKATSSCGCGTSFDIKV